MSSSPRVSGLVLGCALPLSEAHADAVLELAFLMSAVDGHLAEEELGAFRELTRLIRGPEDPNDLLERFVVASHTVGVEHRVRQVADMVPENLREMAFKVAVGLSLIDHEESEHEDELVGILGAALGLAERSIPLAGAARFAVRLRATRGATVRESEDPEKTWPRRATIQTVMVRRWRRPSLRRASREAARRSSTGRRARARGSARGRCDRRRGRRRRRHRACRRPGARARRRRAR